MHAVCVWLFSVFAVPGAVPYASRESNTRVVCTRPEDCLLHVVCVFLGCAEINETTNTCHASNESMFYFSKV